MTVLAATAVLLLVSTVIGIASSRQAHRDAARLAQEARRSGQELRSEQYTRDVKYASELWADNRPGEILTILDRYRLALGEEDLRGFVWH